MLNQIGDTLHGFTVTRIRESEELGGRIVEMTFTQTGTELVWIDNHAENKLFSVAFKTLPENSTGVFHILEHSVLCGSKKYPVREPFVELLKSSMNTFLNAMTFSDKTMYPVSSRNPRDFLNLTAVYLDAVFAPAILENPNIFYQEGWHIEEDEGGSFSYKGVVFNEMKGAMSSVEDLAEYKLISMLFPDTCYGFNSGGDPAVIPTLTYEKFTETYHRFYHPSNARIFLDGDIPLEETLALIEEYLSQFERSTDLPEITMQTPVSSKATQYYELAKDEELTDQTVVTAGRIIGTWRDRTKLIALRVLLDAVAGSNETPIKRAVLSAGLAKELDISIDDSIAQPYLTIQLKNVRDGKADEVLPLIRKTAAALAENGLDYDALEASANRLAFYLLEPEEPQGLDRCINCMNSWLHGGDPMQYIVYDADFAAVRQMLKDHAFEALLRETLVEESGTAVLYSLPSYTRGDELRAEEEARLAETTSKWSEADLAANRTLNEKLLAWQQTPDSAEQLATLPVLSLSEVSPEPSWTETEVQQLDGVTVLYHPVPSRGIVHITLTFRLTDLSLNELTAASHIGSLYGKLPTAHYTALELQQALKNKVGRLTAGVEVFAKDLVTDVCTPVLTVRCSVLADRMTDAFDLIEEVLLTTDFTQKDKIREIVTQTNERMKQMGVMAGHALGITAVMSRYAAKNAVRCAVSGYPVIKQTQQLVREFDEQFDAFSGLMQSVQAKLCRARLHYASVSASKNADITPLLERFPAGESVPAEAPYTADIPERAGYTIPAQIGFAVQGFCLPEKEYGFNSGWRAAAKIISLSYLWNVVRVQGGAYGTGISLMRDGSVFTYSYRDPSPARSLAVNGGISEFIRQFCESGEPLDKFIISTVNDEEPLQSPRAMGITADSLWCIGKTKADLTADRKELLAAARETLLDSCRIWDAFAENGAVFVSASENLLADCEDLTVLD